MGTRRRCSDRAVRYLMRSPGRPPVARREDRRRFWAAIAAGLSSEAAAVDAGVSPAVGVRWFREAGGMPPATLAPSSKPPSERYLSFTEREGIAVWRAQGHGVREIARRLGRAASTLSRELRRNAATRSGGLEYRATTAQWHADRRASRPKLAKLAVNDALRRYVQDRLAGTDHLPRRHGGPSTVASSVPRRRHGEVVASARAPSTGTSGMRLGLGPSLRCRRSTASSGRSTPRSSERRSRSFVGRHGQDHPRTS